jgi:hypothetical protein
MERAACTGSPFFIGDYSSFQGSGLRFRQCRPLFSSQVDIIGTAHKAGGSRPARRLPFCPGGNKKEAKSALPLRGACWDGWQERAKKF